MFANEGNKWESIYSLDIWFFEHSLEFTREEITSISSKAVEEYRETSEEYPVNIAIEALTKKLGLKEIEDHDYEFTGPYSKIAIYSFDVSHFE